jgi:hypothetical protein
VAGLEVADRLHLRALFLVASPEQRCGCVFAARISIIEESVHPDDGQRTIVLARLVEQALFLDLAALVHGFHGTQHAAALGQRLELLVYSLFDEVRQSLDA